jgi:hypothetical protein
MAQVPEEYLCPINLTLMNDPVIGSDGRSYERAAITQWLRTNPHSPITRQPMNVSSLKPNYALKTAIDRFTASARAPPPPPVRVATAPPVDDVYYAMTVYQQDLIAQQQGLLLAQQQQALRYGPQSGQTTLVVAPAPTALSAENRRKKALVMCLCLAVGIALIVVVSRIVVSSNN